MAVNSWKIAAIRLTVLEMELKPPSRNDSTSWSLPSIRTNRAHIASNTAGSNVTARRASSASSYKEVSVDEEVHGVSKRLISLQLSYSPSSEEHRG